MTDTHSVERYRSNFAMAVEAYRNDANNPSLSVTLKGGRDVLVTTICAEMVHDGGLMPETLRSALNLSSATTYADGARYLQTYISLNPTNGGWEK